MFVLCLCMYQADDSEDEKKEEKPQSSGYGSSKDGIPQAHITYKFKSNQNNFINKNNLENSKSYD